MARGDQVKSTRVNPDWTKARKVTAPISLEDLMENEVQSSLEDGAIRELSVLTAPANEDSTRIKRKIRILDHPKNLIEVLCARLSIAQGLIGNNITMGPNQYRFTQNFLDEEALRIFELKSTELRHKTVANLIIVMNHVVAYFVPKVCLSKQKCYIQQNGKKRHKKKSSLYCSIHGKHKSHTTREYKVPKASNKDRDKPKY